MFNAFISYSHAADDKFAPALQNALQNFAKPWHKKRNLEIFLDESNLPPTPELRKNINAALDESEYLILLANPLSEKSDQVNKEIEYWLEHKSINTLLIALTGGNLEWDRQNNCFFNLENNSLPPVLDNKFTDEPFYIDLRQSKTEEDLSLDNPIFKKEVLKLAAKLHGKFANDLASEEVTVHRKMIRTRNSAIGILASLLILAIIAGCIANEQRKAAVYETRKSLSLTFAAIASDQQKKNPTHSIRLAQLAWQTSPSHPPGLPLQIAILQGYYEPLEYKKLFYKNKLEHEYPVSSAVFSPDGKMIATASEGKTVKIWDVFNPDLNCSQ